MDINFKGTSSTSFTGLTIKELPDMPQAERNIEKVEVQGRDGFLTVDQGTYKGITLAIHFQLVSASRISTIASIKNWLQGSGDLIISTESDKKYIATVISKFDIGSVLFNLSDFVVIFDCQPHRYAITRTYIDVTTTPNTVTNSGNAPVYPVITVYGSGTVTLSVGSQSLTITGISSYVTIDGELFDCYKDSTLMNNNMSGDFPILQVGSNAVSWTGTVTKVNFAFNARWI